MTAKSGRIVWIDQLRSVAFLFVIIGHVAIPKEMKSLIYSFHMPLFFLISGLPLNNQKILNIPFKDYVSKQAKSLLVPYFWLNFLCYPLWYISFQILTDSKQTIPGVFKGIFLGCFGIDFPSNALWFLLVLFIAIIIYAGILKFSKGNDGTMLCLVLVCAIVGYLDKAFAQIWHFNVAFTAVMLLYLGNIFINWYKQSKLYNHKKSFDYVIKTLGVALCFIIIGFQSHKMNGRVSVTANKFGKSVLLFYVTAIAFSLAITLIVMLLPKISFVTYIGQNTLFYLGIHIPIIRILEKAFPEIFLQYKYSIPLAFVLYIALIPIAMLVKKLFPYVCGVPTKKNTTFSNICKVFMVMWCTVIPYGYVSMKFGFLSYTISSVIINGFVLLALSALFVCFVRKFVPVIFLEEKVSKNTKSA